MKKIVMATLLALALGACGSGESAKAVQQEWTALDAATRGPSAWVFVQLNVPKEVGGMDTYYYFARVSSPIYERIRRKELERGFITLQDVRYWNNDDRIQAYRDAADSGELVFRIEDIRMISLLRKEPRVGDDYDQHEERQRKPGSAAEIEKDVEAEAPAKEPARVTPAKPEG